MKPRTFPAAVTFLLGLFLILMGSGRLLWAPDMMEWFLTSRTTDAWLFVYITFFLDQLASGVLLLSIGLTLLYAAGGIREQKHWASIVSLINTTLAAIGVFLLLGAVFGVVVQSAVASRTALPLKMMLWLLLALVAAAIILLIIGLSAYRSRHMINEKDRLGFPFIEFQERGGLRTERGATERAVSLRGHVRVQGEENDGGSSKVSESIGD